MNGSWTVGEEFYQFGTAVWDASRPTEQISQVGRLHIPMPLSRGRVHVLLSLDTTKTDISSPADHAAHASPDSVSPGAGPSTAPIGCGVTPSG